MKESACPRNLCSPDSGSPNFLMLFCQRATTFLGWGGKRGKVGGGEQGPCSSKSLPPKHVSIVRKNDLYLPSSIGNSAAKNGMNSSSGNLSPVCKASSRSQPWSCCCVAAGAGGGRSRELSRVFFAQCWGKRVFKEFWCRNLQQKVLGWYLQTRGGSGKSGNSL